MTEYYFSADNKVKTAQLFVHNLLWGFRQKDEKISELTYQRDQVTAELANITNKEPPMKRDYKAVQ